MKILMIADREERYLWDYWNESTAHIYTACLFA